MIRHSAAAMAALVIGLSAGQASAGLDAENVLTPLPSGFKIGAQGRTATGSMSEYIPQAETVQDWSTMVTVMIMHIKTAPDQFATGMFENVKGGCPGIQTQKVTEGTENGYAFSLWLADCPLNPATGKPESFFMKVVAGNDALYNVQYAYRQDMTKALMVPAMTYLKQVKVCDTRDASHPCPAGM